MEIEMIPVAADDELEADGAGLADLGHAMSNGHTAAMEKCVTAILETPIELMPPDQKFSHLWLSGSLYGAFRYGQADAAAGFTRLVASAPSSALEPLLQLKLLLWPVSTRLEFDVPLLHSIATARQVEVGRDLRLRQHRTIFGYLHEIAASGNLSVAFKTMLCAAMHGNRGTTAARTALCCDNPGAAAAMMCGILSASADTLLTQNLLQCLGVRPGDVLLALRSTSHSEDAQWAPLLLALLDEWGLPRDEFEPLMRDFAVEEVS